MLLLCLFYSSTFCDESYTEVGLNVQSVEEAGEVKALEAPPERLMIEPAKPAVSERFAAAEKALEEQLLREEQEELERERCVTIHSST